MTGQNSGFRAVILDYGQVLCHAPAPADIERMANVFGVAAAEFPHMYGRPRRAYDRGDLTAEEYWKQIATEAGASLSAADVEKLRKWDVELWSSIDPNMMAWVDELNAAGMKTAILSNMHPDMVAHVRRECEWARKFTCAVYSSELRVAKPEAAIYEHTLRCLEVAASQALFVDDNPENVRGAEAVGIRSLQMRTAAEFRRDLEEMGFSVLPVVGSQ